MSAARCYEVRAGLPRDDPAFSEPVHAELLSWGEAFGLRARWNCAHALDDERVAEVYEHGQLPNGCGWFRRVDRVARLAELLGVSVEQLGR